MTPVVPQNAASEGPAADRFGRAGLILFNLAMNCGPKATTFTLAPELFPTAVRGFASGFAAASAKAGATFGILRFAAGKGICRRCWCSGTYGRCQRAWRRDHS